MNDAIKAELQRSADTISNIDPAQIRRAADVLIEAFRNGNQAIFMGNGGSSADAQHIAAEFSGRYMLERPALPGVCLSNIAPVTAIGNDYSYDLVFKRQVEAICRKGDVVIGMSTSGNSKNVILAMEAAKERGAVTMSFTGDGGKLREMVDVAVIIPSKETPRIQEGYLCACHTMCGIVERELFGQRAVFIDRDDTVAKNVPYCDDPDKFEVYPDVPEAIARLNRAGYLVIVITNQSGLNRGYFDLATLDAIHSKLRSTVEAGGGRIDDIFYLPPNVPERYLRHSDGPAAGYGELWTSPSLAGVPGVILYYSILEKSRLVIGKRQSLVFLLADGPAGDIGHGRCPGIFVKAYASLFFHQMISCRRSFIKKIPHSHKFQKNRIVCGAFHKPVAEMPVHLKGMVSEPGIILIIGRRIDAGNILADITYTVHICKFQRASFLFLQPVPFLILMKDFFDHLLFFAVCNLPVLLYRQHFLPLKVYRPAG